jgi:hypothetical protein
VCEECLQQYEGHIREDTTEASTVVSLMCTEAKLMAADRARQRLRVRPKVL